jgi:hypothetical protein
VSTPEELLCNRRWRIVHGLWMLWGILSFGVFACVGWLYIGLRSKSRLFLTVGGVLLAWTVAFLALYSAIDLPAGKGVTGTPTQETQSNLLYGSATVVWIASSIGAWFANRRWLVWRANRDAALPWYANATSTPQPPPAPNSQQVSANVDAAFATGPAASSTRTPQAAESGATLNLNSATASQLAELPGLNAETAAHVVAVRARVGGFDAAPDLVTEAGIQPHVFAQIQGRVSVTDKDSNPPPTPSPESGRRLEF